MSTENMLELQLWINVDTLWLVSYMSKINTSRSAENIPVLDVITADNLGQNNKFIFC